MWEGTQKYSSHDFSQLNSLSKQKTFIKLQVKTNQLDESQARIKIARRNINNFRYAGDTTRMAESKEELKSLLKVQKESEKADLKFNIQKTKIMASGPITSWQIEGEKVEAETNLFSRAPELLHTVVAAMELKDVCSLEGMLWKA